MQVKPYCFEHSTFSKMETCWIFQLTGDKFQQCLQDIFIFKIKKMYCTVGAEIDTVMWRIDPILNILDTTNFADTERFEFSINKIAFQ